MTEVHKKIHSLFSGGNILCLFSLPCGVRTSWSKSHNNRFSAGFLLFRCLVWSDYVNVTSGNVLLCRTHFTISIYKGPCRLRKSVFHFQRVSVTRWDCSRNYIRNTTQIRRMRSAENREWKNTFHAESVQPGRRIGLLMGKLHALQTTTTT